MAGGWGLYKLRGTGEPVLKTGFGLGASVWSQCGIVGGPRNDHRLELILESCPRSCAFWLKVPIFSDWPIPRMCPFGWWGRFSEETSTLGSNEWLLPWLWRWENWYWVSWLMLSKFSEGTFTLGSDVWLMPWIWLCWRWGCWCWCFCRRKFWCWSCCCVEFKCDYW